MYMFLILENFLTLLNTFMKIRILLFIAIFPLLVSFSSSSGGNKNKESTKETVKDSSSVLSYQNLYDEIVRNGIDHPEIVFAQAILESGHFKSKVFRENRNLFGMKMPRSRKTLAKKSLNGYAFYTSWKESVADYKLYQQSYLKGKSSSKESYYSNLNKRYASIGGSYSSHLKKIVNRYSKIINYHYKSNLDE